MADDDQDMEMCDDTEFLERVVQATEAAVSTQQQQQLFRPPPPISFIRDSGYDRSSGNDETPNRRERSEKTSPSYVKCVWLKKNKQTNANLNKGSGIGEYVWKDVTMLKAKLLETRAKLLLTGGYFDYGEEGKIATLHEEAQKLHIVRGDGIVIPCDDVRHFGDDVTSSRLKEVVEDPAGRRRRN
ncbi:hypothetical protein Tco_0652564 [Tanacetum coccineum]|uniref:Uncharacterized protein n=1 Tax=Tanacetum coccineum TaxID=301880 RepID=A0ABQ4WY59_9ASTR